MVNHSHIGLLRLSALGDVIAMLPLLRTLQQAYPQATITWIVADTFLPLLSALQGPRMRVVAVKKPRALRDYIVLIKTLRAFSFDLFLGTHASLRVNPLYLFVRATRKIGFNKTLARDGQWLFFKERTAAAAAASPVHLVDGFLGFAQKLKIQPANFQITDWQLPVPLVELQWARQLLLEKKTKNKTTVDFDRWLLVNPCASSTQKTWPLARYIETLNKLLQRWPLGIVITGGSDSVEVEFNQRLVKQLPSERVLNCTGRTTLPQLAALIATVDFVVAPDTGPLHVAVALGTPVIGLYAVTDPARFGPYRFRDYCIHQYSKTAGTQMSDITVDLVLKKVELLLKDCDHSLVPQGTVL